MTKANKAVKSDIESRLVARYGLLMGPTQIREALCFPTAEAFRAAVSRGKVGVRTFAIDGRRGRFAMTVEIAAFLDEQQKQSYLALSHLSEEETPRTN